MVKANETQNEGEERRCLLVEDRKETESEYKELLELLEFSIKVTKDSKEALQIIEEWSPHIMLVHFSHDIPSSINLIKEVSEKDSTVSTVYTTAYHDASVFVKALNAGAFWILWKPFMPIELETILARAFKESVQKKSLRLSSSYVFVLMPFGKEFDEIYQLAIKEPLVNKGLNCERADEIQAAGGIMEQIYSGIKQARFIVADMTGRNANVFYEVGYAHAIKNKKDVILLTKKKEDIPFDLTGYRHIIYGESIINLREELLKKVEALLSEKI
jgi:DNA-binding response OmpR family regulator